MVAGSCILGVGVISEWFRVLLDVAREEWFRVLLEVAGEASGMVAVVVRVGLLFSSLI